MSRTFFKIPLRVSAHAPLLFLLFFAFSGFASGQTFTVTNSAAITINDLSTASLYPSNITVSNAGNSITKLTLTLNNLTHSYPGDIDMMLVAPNGNKIVFFSDSCSSNSMTNRTITFDDAASSTMPTAACSAASYRPTNYTAGDTFPSPATNPVAADNAAPDGSATFAGKFNGIDPNGIWKLYIVDDAGGDTGTLAGGWSLTITSVYSFSNASAITILDNANASVYPSTINVSGIEKYVEKVTLRLNGLSHTYPGDVGMMLVAPNGARFIFMSRVCDNPDLVNVNITFDDAAAAALPDAGPCTGGTFRPSVAGTSAYPAPAPQPTGSDYAGAGGATFANRFNGIDPNGTWSLYIRDNAAQDSGSLAGGWTLNIAPSNVTAAPASIAGRVLDADGRGIPGARIKIADTVSGETRIVSTNPFGYYRISDLGSGNAYIITAEHKRYTFQNNPRLVQMFEDQDVQFTAEP